MHFESENIKRLDVFFLFHKRTLVASSAYLLSEALPPDMSATHRKRVVLAAWRVRARPVAGLGVAAGATLRQWLRVGVVGDVGVGEPCQALHHPRELIVPADAL